MALSESAPLPTAVVPTMGITIYGCEADEADLFRDLAPRLGFLPTITAAPLAEDNVELAAGDRCISIGHKTRVTEPTLRALSRAGVRHISTRSVGFNHLDLGCAESVGISVANVAYSPDSVADYTLMLILMALRNVRSMLKRVDSHDYRLGDVRGRELRDQTVGVVGIGRIGEAVIDRLEGFGCEIAAYDPRRRDLAAWAPLEQVLERSDVVTLHTPLNAETHHLLDRRRLARMRPGAYVVNTGRGALLDTEALLEAIERGALGGAALDVLEGEEGVFYRDCRDRPPTSDLLQRLQAQPNVIVSPHTAYFTDHALADTVEMSIRSCLEFESERRRRG